MVESLLNYTASFAISADQTRIKSNETYVPFSAVQNWFTNFERKLQQNPNFWKNWYTNNVYNSDDLEYFVNPKETTLRETIGNVKIMYITAIYYTFKYMLFVVCL